MQMTEHIPGVVHFSTADGEGIKMPHDDALVVEAIIHNFKVQKILVDDGSKVNLLPYRMFQAMNIPEKNLVKDQAPVKDIEGTSIPAEGKIKLLLTLGIPSTTQTQYAMVLVVKLPLVYNTILGQLMLYEFKVATSIQYLCMKFPIEEGIATFKGRQEESQAIYLAVVAREEEEEVRDEKKEQRTQPAKELENFALSEGHPKKTFSINANLSAKQKKAFETLVQGYASTFTWKSADMPRIDLQIMSHELNVSPKVKSIK